MRRHYLLCGVSSVQYEAFAALREPSLALWRWWHADNTLTHSTPPRSTQANRRGNPSHKEPCTSSENLTKQFAHDKYGRILHLEFR